MVLEITQTKVILCGSVIFYGFTSLSEVGNRLSVFLYLSIAISAVEEGLKVCFTCLDILESFSEILNGVSEVHESGVDETTIEVVKAIVRLKTNGLLELRESVINLVEHHHAVAPIRVVLWVFVIETNSRAEVVHCFLVVTSRHECITTIGMILGVC